MRNPSHVAKQELRQTLREKASLERKLSGLQEQARRLQAELKEHLSWKVQRVKVWKEQVKKNQSEIKRTDSAIKRQQRKLDQWAGTYGNGELTIVKAILIQEGKL